MKIPPSIAKPVPSTPTVNETGKPAVTGPLTGPLTGAAALAQAGAAIATESFRPAGGAAPTDIEGTSRGYVSPTKVESPFTSDEKQVLSQKIPCPALAGMFNAGMLKVEKDGTVKIPDLERALSQLGPSAATRKILTNGADNTDDIKGQFNLFKLNGSNLDHTGSSGIRQNGVHPERFEALMKHSKDGERLTAKDLADAADSFAKADPGLRGRLTQLVEVTAVLDVFGRTAPDGTRYFTREDAKQLFVDGQIPSSWSPPHVPGKVGLGDVLGGAAMGLFRQLVNRD